MLQFDDIGGYSGVKAVEALDPRRFERMPVRSAPHNNQRVIAPHRDFVGRLRWPGRDTYPMLHEDGGTFVYYQDRQSGILFARCEMCGFETACWTPGAWHEGRIERREARQRWMRAIWKH